MFVCEHVCVCVNMCVQVHDCMCMWRQSSASDIFFDLSSELYWERAQREQTQSHMLLKKVLHGLDHLPNPKILYNKLHISAKTSLKKLAIESDRKKEHNTEKRAVTEEKMMAPWHYLWLNEEQIINTKEYFKASESNNVTKILHFGTHIGRRNGPRHGDTCLLPKPKAGRDYWIEEIRSSGLSSTT